MGREIRRVPPNWQHPKDERGNFIPLLDGDYETEAREYAQNVALWKRGEHPDQIENWEGRAAQYKYYCEWNGPPPKRDEYRPAWTPEEATHYQIYETVTEGTPKSPVFETTDQMFFWLINQGYSEDAADGFIKSGWAPTFTMTFSPRGMEIHDNLKLYDIED